jgi:hypothetical protein
MSAPEPNLSGSDAAALERELATAREDTARLVKAASGMLENYLTLKRISLALANSDGAWAIHRWPDGPYGDAHNMAMLWEAKGCPPANVWIGVSAETQARLDERVPLLLRIPARVRFVSAEPLLGPLDFASLRWPDADGVAAGDSAGIDWLIVGGESGPGARPCDVAWIRSIVRQCADAGVACFVKQLGARPYLSPEHDGGTGFNLTLRDKKGGDPAEWPADLRVRQLPK